MKWFFWLKRKLRRKPPSATACPKCGREMHCIDKTSFSGNDMRTYRCDRCGDEHIMDFGIATWRAMSGRWPDSEP